MKKRPEEAPLNRACIEERLRDDENSSKGKIYEKVLRVKPLVEKVCRRHLYTRVTRQGKKTRMFGRGNENGWEWFYLAISTAVTITLGGGRVSKRRSSQARDRSGASTTYYAPWLINSLERR